MNLIFHYLFRGIILRTYFDVRRYIADNVLRCLSVGILLCFNIHCLAQANALWWQRFRSEQLDSLMEECALHNLEVRQAQERIFQAKAAYRSSFGAFTPSISLQTGWMRERQSQNLMDTPSASVYSSYYSGLLSASLTVDIFGKLRKATEAQRALYKASKAERELILLTMSQEVANAYFSLCAMRQLIAVVESNINSQKEVVQITEAQYNAGLVSKLDMTQALSTLYSTQADISTYRSNAQNYLDALAVLLATEPSILESSLTDADSLPEIEYLLPKSVNMEDLRLRPDLRQEEWVIEEMNANLGGAKKEWLPTFLVTGHIGLMSHELPDLLEHRSYTWLVEPVMQWSVFTGGQRIEAIKQAKSALQEQVDNYNLLLLTALKQMSSATTAYRQSLEQSKNLKKAVQQAEESLTLSMELYKQGLTAFINVVQAQQSVLQYQISYVTACNDALQNLVALFVSISPGVSQ